MTKRKNEFEHMDENKQMKDKKQKLEYGSVQIQVPIDTKVVFNKEEVFYIS